MELNCIENIYYFGGFLPTAKRGAITMLGSKNTADEDPHAQRLH
jgi:hypothetical protein